MAEILVLAEHMDDDIKKVTLELITLARRFGEPAVVWTGPGAEQAQARCAEYGAAKMYVAAAPAFDDYVVAPAAELLAQLVREKSPALVLLAGTAQGKEVAGRLAVKIDSGVLTDAVDLQPGDDGPVAEQSNFGGSTIVHVPGQAGHARSWRCGPTRWRPSPSRARRSSPRCRWPARPPARRSPAGWSPSAASART